MACDYDNEFKCGDSLYDLTKKILGRLKQLVGFGPGGGGGGGDVTLTVSDVEIGAVELKDSSTDNRATVRNTDPDPTDYGLVVRNIPSGTQAVSGPFLTDAQLSARLNTLGQKTMALSAPVVIASNQSAFPVTVAGVATQTGLDTISGQIDALTNTVATEAGLSSIFNELDFLTSGLTIDLASRASEATLATMLTLAGFQARINTLGQKTMAASTPVVIASDQGVIPVSQSGTWTVQPGNTPNTVPGLVADDWRRNSPPKRYIISVILTPANATAGTNLMGLRKLNANADVYIIRIKAHVFQAAAGVAATLGWRRATTVAAGTLIAAADVPKMDTAAGNATLEVRTGAVTGTEAAQYIITHPAHTTAVPAAGQGTTFIDEWNANDRAGSIRLTGDEGLILEQVTASDVDNRFYITIEWEEA